MASRPLPRQKSSSLPRLSSLWRRLIHYRHGIQDDSPLGLTELRGYQRITFPELAKQKVCLWNGNKMLGVMAMPRVMKEFLGPGKMLSWRPSDEVLSRSDSQTHRSGDSEGRSSANPLKGVLDYEIIDISRPGSILISAFRSKLKENGMHEVPIRPVVRLADPETRLELMRAYQLLAHPRDGARYPVRFHVQRRERPFDAKWAVRNRVDLHPEVMIRALPDGVWCTTFPRIHRDGSDVVWSWAAKHYEPRPRRSKGPTSRRLAQAGEGSDERRPKAAHGGGEPSDKMAATSAGREQRVEHALEKALRKSAKAIRVKYNNILRAATRRRHREVLGSPAAPLPEERAGIEERIEVVIERAMPKVRESVQRTFGIEPGPATAAKSDAVDESESAHSSPKSPSQEKSS